MINVTGPASTPTPTSVPSPAAPPAPASTPVTPAAATQRKLRKKKGGLSPKAVLGILFLVLVLIGTGAGYYLTQMQQDIRQQAYVGQECGPGLPACTGANEICGNEGECVEQVSGCSSTDSNSTNCGSCNCSGWSKQGCTGYIGGGCGPICHKDCDWASCKNDHSISGCSQCSTCNNWEYCTDSPTPTVTQPPGDDDDDGDDDDVGPACYDITMYILGAGGTRQSELQPGTDQDDQLTESSRVELECAASETPIPAGYSYKFRVIEPCGPGDTETPTIDLTATGNTAQYTISRPGHFQAQCALCDSNDVCDWESALINACTMEPPPRY